MSSAITAEVPTEQSIAAVVRSSTAAEHRAAEERPFIVELMGGDLSLDDYTRYLAQFGYVYEALESRPRTSNDPALFDPALARTASIEHDLGALGASDWRSQHPTLEATKTYASHLRSIPADDTVRWVAHHYTRYLGDLSGGQAIARLVARHYGATPEQLTYFDFTAIGDLVPYKRSYREQLDALKLEPGELDALVDETRLAYALNSAVFDELAK
jgi:heme oxygenase (biliverdin-producing, ferredoxin)